MSHYIHLVRRSPLALVLAGIAALAFASMMPVSPASAAPAPHDAAR